MKNRKISIIAEGYPTVKDPFFTFVQQLAYVLSNEGLECSIIAPQSLTKSVIRDKRIKPLKSIDKTPEGKIIKVYRPITITFSNTKLKFFEILSQFFTQKAIKRGIKLAGKQEILYTYFWHIGLLTSTIKGNIPLVVQASECELTISKYLKKNSDKTKVDKVICASSKNLKETLEANLAPLEKCSIVVNGYRPDEFYQIDKEKARVNKGIDKDKFIIAFVGGFIERKGIVELSNVIDRFDNVYSIFIGTGRNEPKCKNILLKERIEHNKLVEYLNCADVFVLPTRAEGCCNAIIEALACGLPVISSNKSFNDEILDETCSIRVNERSENELYEAIKRLKEDSALRKRLSIGAIEKAKTLDIKIRGRKISNIINKILG